MSAIGDDRISYRDTVRAIREGRPVFCSPCANERGGFDAGHLVCDDGKAVPCSVCGTVTRPIRNVIFEET